MTEIVPARFATSMVIPPLRSRRRAGAALAVMAAGYAAIFALAAIPAPNATAVALVAVAALELTLPGRAPIVPWAMRYVGLTSIARGALRGAAVVLLAARSAPGAVVIAAAVTLAVTAAAETLRAGTAEVVAHFGRPPIAARGLRTRLEAARPRSPLLGRVAGGAALLEVGTGVLVAVNRHLGTGGTVVGLAAATAIPLGAAAAGARQALMLRRAGLRSGVTAAMEQALHDLAPEVIIYFGSTAEWTYQLDVWLPVLERIQRRVLLVARDGGVLDQLSPSPLPVIVVTSAGVLMRLRLPSARVALYVGNTANNIHLLRRAELNSVFIGHGDSDKASSSNPFSRVYREVWVAGAAGRDRFETAGIGIAPEAFVEVGRPTLGDLSRHRDPGSGLTVLYAPTWEGFGERDDQSSLATLGPELIRRLLQRPQVRVIYRPHPRAGHRDPALRRAHRQIVAMLRQAGPAHVIVTPPYPDLNSTLAATDVLIADISSVTTDFLAADRPYAVLNVRRVPDETFAREYASAAGGFVLGPDFAALDALLSAGAGGTDPTAVARRAAARYILGPRPTDPAEPFLQAVDRVCGALAPVLQRPEP